MSNGFTRAKTVLKLEAALKHKMELEGLVVVAISAVGLISLCNSIVNFVRWVWMMFLRPPKNLKECYGSWAVVTGATDGIGKALAVELASKGLNLVLVGRNPSKLDLTSNEILERSGGQVLTKTIVIDFAKQSGEEMGRAIEEGIEGLDVGLLINNAGMSYPYARFLHEVDLELTESIIRVNIEGTSWATRAVLPSMLKKKRGAIVNIGSGASAAVPSYPLLTIYSATKAYISMFSKCISLEYKSHGIDIQCQIPLFVATKMPKITRSSFFIPSPEKYSKASVRAIGYEKTSVPYWPHALQWCIIRALPHSLLDCCLLRYFLWIRQTSQHIGTMKHKQQKINP